MNFDILGIICEYNPFHFGHLYHINQAKKLSNADKVVCIMSGSMVQRGEPAVYDKWTRARMAVEYGADLVIELPAYYALQSADNFAYGAVKILDELKVVDALCFGSECNDIELLKTAARLTAYPDDAYKCAFNDALSRGCSYPASCESGLRASLGEVDSSFFSPNNTLGMCYVSALDKLKSSIEPISVLRNNDYHSSDSSDGFRSASSIREMMTTGADTSLYAPAYPSAHTYSMSNADSFILGFYRNISADMLCDIKGFEDGLANLVISAARTSCTSEQMFEKCVSKRYTLHRIKRFCMCGILGIKGDYEPDYIRVLAMNSTGTGILRNIKENSQLRIVTKAADFAGSPMYDMDIHATDFAALCCDDVSNRYCGADYLHSPYFSESK